MLSAERFLAVVRDTPLVSIDLVLRDPAGRVLMGLRTNEPAKGCWFVPGGRIRKDETLEQAFARISATELGTPLPFSGARLLGAFTHCYDTNFAGAPDVSTHYVVLAYAAAVERGTASTASLPRAQHASWRWWSADEAKRSDEVHPNNLPYF